MDQGLLARPSRRPAAVTGRCLLASKGSFAETIASCKRNDAQAGNPQHPPADCAASLRLEPDLWDSLAEAARREGLTPGEVAARPEAERSEGGRTSALRAFLMTYFRQAATETGHKAAGHGPPAMARPAPDSSLCRGSDAASR